MQLACKGHAQIAQSVEQWIENPRVPGSIPGLGTIFKPEVRKELRVFYLPEILFLENTQAPSLIFNNNTNIIGVDTRYGCALAGGDFKWKNYIFASTGS